MGVAAMSAYVVDDFAAALLACAAAAAAAVDSDDPAAAAAVTLIVTDLGPAEWPPAASRAISAGTGRWRRTF